MTAIPIEQLPDNLREYQVSHTFDRDFCNSLNKLHRKYGDEVFEVLGIANRNLDIALFSDDFFSKSVANVADVSVDDNANVSEKNISHYDAESTKALQKLNSLATMYLWVKKCFTKKDADNALEKLMNGEIFLNDATKYNFPYCFSFDLRNLLFEGMSFFKGNFKINPPKRSDTFITLMIQTVAYISNQIAGAASFPDWGVCLDWYLRKEFGEDYATKIKTDDKIKTHLKHLFQNWIYSVNFPFRGAGQSAFTNLSVMDKGFMKALFTKDGINGQDYVFPDNTIANIESTSELMKSFFEYYTEINSVEGLFTFPVMTLAISKDPDGNFIDPEFVDWVCKVNSEKALGNMYVGEPTSYSSCCRLKLDLQKSSSLGYTNSFGVGGLSIGCYDEKTEVLTENGWMLFSELIARNSEGIKVITMNPKSKEVEIQTPTAYFVSEYSGEMHHYSRQGLDLLVTPNHNFPVYKKIKKAPYRSEELEIVQSQHLTQTHSLPRFGEALVREDLKEITVGSTVFVGDQVNKYFQLLGMFIGDGSVYHNPDEHLRRGYPVSFQLKKERKIKVLEQVLIDLGIHYTKSFVSTRGSYNIVFNSKDLALEFCAIGKTLNKHIPRKYLSCGGTNNLRHLFQGLQDTDGSQFNGTWYYTASPQLANDVMELAGLLGIPTNLSSRRRDPSWIERDKRYITSDNEHFEIKFLLKDAVFNKIVVDRKIKTYSGKIYCVEVPNHILFVRRNGKTAWCGNSHRCAGLNLPRLALLEKENPNIFEETMEVLHNILFSHRELIKSNIQSGTLPLYTSNWISLNRQYSTVGFVGLHEYFKNKGMNSTDESTILEGIKLLKKIENKLIHWQEKEKTIWNCEQIPAESQAVKLCQLDTLLGFNPNRFTLYSNQYLPLWEEASIYDRFKLQGKFDSLTSGGAILHINVQDSKPLSPIQFKALLEQARITGTTYFAINLAFSECEQGHYSIGQKEACPSCKGKIVNEYTRVVGYLSKVSAWNKVRRTEDYPNRHFYSNGKLVALEKTM